MNRDRDLDRAIKFLENKYKVIPEKYSMYNGGYLFLAYPKGVKDKEQCMTPWYLVDLRRKAVGRFSPAFDMDGFDEATKYLKRL